MKEKYAICFLSNENYIYTTKVTIYSFLKNNSWFNGDIIIIINDYISENSKEELKKIYENIIFNNIDYSFYIPYFEKLNKYDFFNFYCPYLYKLETFKINGYKKLAYFDTDLLFMGNVSDLFMNEYDFIACEDKKEEFIRIDKKIKEKEYINSGVFVIDEKEQGKYEEVINYLNIFIQDSINNKQQRLRFEQDFLNYYLENKNCILYPTDYNAFQQLFFDNRKKISTEKIIHYLSLEKPWNSKNCDIWNYIHDFWKKTFDEIENTVDIFTMATGLYTYYFEKFLETVHNFLPDKHKRIHIISDSLKEYNGYNKDNISIEVMEQINLPYPLLPLLKTYFIEHYMNNNMTYIFWCDIDTIFLEKSNEYWNWFLKSLNNNELLMAIQPGNIYPTYSIIEESQAYIPEEIIKERKYYSIISSFWGGKLSEVKKVCEQMNEMIRKDLQYHKNDNCYHYIPSLFDQDYLNKIVYESNGIDCNIRKFIYVGWLEDRNEENCVEQKYDTRRKNKIKNINL